MNNSIKETTSSLKWWCIVLIVAGCLCFWILGIWGAHCLATKFSNGNNIANAGLIGDSAGAINALFSAFAFAGVIIAIILQKKELELQRDELKATNAQLEAQKEEFHTQNETLKRQRFENTFFQMMSLQQEIVNNLRIDHKERQNTETRTEGHHSKSSSTTNITQTITGRSVFYRIFDKAGTILRNEDGKKEETVRGVREAILKKGIDIYASLKYPEYFDHYFRHLYRIIKFVDESGLIEKKEKYEYIGMIRATLSRYELVWLFYNCLSENGKDKFKPLIEHYALLKNLRRELLVDEKHWSLYEKGAYEYAD